MAKFLKNQVLKIVMMVAAMIKLMKELVHLKLMKELVHLSILLEKRMDWFTLLSQRKDAINSK